MTTTERPILDTFLNAATATERLQLVQAWLAESNPNVDDLQSVLKELTQKDKGAARPVREHLDLLKDEQKQVELSQEWAGLAQTLLRKERMGIAEGLAWIRDAAKAKAPLSQKPLSDLREALQKRMDAIEDLQNQVAIQKEAALLLTQRIETYSTKSWLQAHEDQAKIEADIQSWLSKKSALEQAPQIRSIDLKYETVLPELAQQIDAVWQAFQGALEEARNAAEDAQASLPAIPVWAEEIRNQRNARNRQQHEKKEPQQTKHSQEHKIQAQAVSDVLQKLEAELSAGHGKASIEQAQSLRELLKQNEGLLHERLFSRAQSALAAAGELADWQRWRTDQIREDLIQKAEALLSEPLPPRKQQETLRILRETWKQSDQGGIPNHALWKIFDQACNQAHKPVEVWLAEVKKNEKANCEARQNLIEELRASTDQIKVSDWREQAKAQQRFETRWREAGHVGEKAFSTLIASWKEALQSTFSALNEAQKNSLTLRKTYIEQATQLAAQRPLPVSAIKDLQIQWQQEAQQVPLHYRQEQKLWSKFKSTLDAAFTARQEESKQRRAEQRAAEAQIQQAIQTLNTVAQQASDAQAIHAALDKVQSVAEELRQGQAGNTSSTTANAEVTAQAETVQSEHVKTAQGTSEQEATQNHAVSDTSSANLEESAEKPDADSTLESTTNADTGADAEANANTPETNAPAEKVSETPKPQIKKVVAVRGDDRPQAQTPAKAHTQQSRHPKEARHGGGQRKDKTRHSDTAFNTPLKKGQGFVENNRGHKNQNTAFELERNLSTPTFNALQAAKDKAFKALKNLQSEAHGQHLLQFLEAWKARDNTQLPKLAELSKRLDATSYQAFAQSIQQQADSATTSMANKALLRLEIMQQLPSPASVQNERRAEQLYLLTQKNQDFSWENETKHVLKGSYTEEGGKRLQAILKKVL